MSTSNNHDNNYDTRIGKRLKAEIREAVQEQTEIVLDHVIPTKLRIEGGIKKIILNPKGKKNTTLSIETKAGRPPTTTSIHNIPLTCNAIDDATELQIRANQKGWSSNVSSALSDYLQQYVFAPLEQETKEQQVKRIKEGGKEG
jgi:hypothetical protein